MKDVLYKTSTDLLNTVCASVSEHEERAILEEKSLSIEKISLSMCKVNVEDEIIIEILKNIGFTFIRG